MLRSSPMGNFVEPENINGPNLGQQSTLWNGMMKLVDMPGMSPLGSISRLETCDLSTRVIGALSVLQNQGYAIFCMVAVFVWEGTHSGKRHPWSGHIIDRFPPCMYWRTIWGSLLTSGRAPASMVPPPRLCQGCLTRPIAFAQQNTTIKRRCGWETSERIPWFCWFGYIHSPCGKEKDNERKKAGLVTKNISDAPHTTMKPQCGKRWYHTSARLNWGGCKGSWRGFNYVN